MKPDLPDETQEATLRILRRALQLIEQPGTWTKGAFARDRHSHPVCPTSERAVRFCVSGALLRAAAEDFKFLVRVASPEEPSPLSIPEPLAEAYRVLGEVITGFFLPVLEASHGVKEESDSTHRAQMAVKLAGGQVITEDASWPVIVHAYNDLRAMNQPIMVRCLQAAVEVVRSSGGETQ